MCVLHHARSVRVTVQQEGNADADRSMQQVDDAYAHHLYGKDSATMPEFLQGNILVREL